MNQPASRPFTLIELLVVIAIIAILASLLLPSLNRARDTAKAIACASQLKQLSLTILNYENDYSGYAPADTKIAGLTYYWPRLLFREGYLSKIGAKILVCPNGVNYYYADKLCDPVAVNNNGNYWASGQYGMNRFFGTHGTGGLVYYIYPDNAATIETDGIYPITRTRSASNTILLVDSFNRRGSLDEPVYYDGKKSGCLALSRSKNGVLDNCPYAIDDRHQGSANIAFVDGHIERERNALRNFQAPIQPNNNLPAPWTGNTCKYFHPEYRY